MTTIRHHRFLPTTTQPPTTTTDTVELYESDIFYFGTEPDIQTWNSHTINSNSPPSSRFKKTSKRHGHPSSSMPVNVPDWSKILLKAPENQRYNNSRNDSDDEDDDIVPPHEFLARQMERTSVVCCSVREGVGRTLKGRDLRRVRNSIWEKTGFQD